MSRIDKLAVLRIGIPGRHAMLVDGFQHHIRPPDDFVIIRQRKRANLSRPMALDTMHLKQTHNLIAIRYRAGHTRFLRTSDQASHRIGARRA